MKMITDILREIRGGTAVALASEQLQRVVLACSETGGKGEVTIKLTVEPDEQGGNEFTIKADVKAKAPIRKLPESVFFSDDAGNLTRENPRQGELAFAEVGRSGTGRA